MSSLAARNKAGLFSTFSARVKELAEKCFSENERRAQGLKPTESKTICGTNKFVP